MTANNRLKYDRKTRYMVARALRRFGLTGGLRYLAGQGHKFSRTFAGYVADEYKIKFRPSRQAA